MSTRPTYETWTLQELKKYIKAHSDVECRIPPIQNKVFLFKDKAFLGFILTEGNCGVCVMQKDDSPIPKLFNIENCGHFNPGNFVSSTAPIPLGGLHRFDGEYLVDKSVND